MQFSQRLREKDADKSGSALYWKTLVNYCLLFTVYSIWPVTSALKVEDINARVRSIGLLTTLECLRLSREVNDELRLGFSDLDLENMMRHSRATDGRVSISRYLQELAKIRSYYR